MVRACALMCCTWSVQKFRTICNLLRHMFNQSWIIILRLWFEYQLYVYASILYYIIYVFMIIYLYLILRAPTRLTFVYASVQFGLLVCASQGLHHSFIIKEALFDIINGQPLSDFGKLGHHENMVMIMPQWRYGGHISWHFRHGSLIVHSNITMFSIIHAMIMVWSWHLPCFFFYKKLKSDLNIVSYCIAVYHYLHTLLKK